jgi:hypothetical protein
MSSWRPQGGPAARPSPRRPGFRPQLLTLEERAVPSTTTATDPGSTTTTPTGTTTTPAVKQIYAVGADVGNQPLVQVYNGDGSVRYSFMAYDANFRGGVRVAVGDVTGDGTPDIVTAPGAGMSGDIKVFDGTSGAQVADFMAYNENFRGGVYVAVADVNNDGHADIITGAGAGGGPHVRVFDGSWAVPSFNGSAPAPVTTPTPAPGLPPSGMPTGVLNEFYAYDPHFAGGVRVSAATVNGKVDIITGAGQSGGPHVKVLDAMTGSLVSEFFAFAPNYAGGVYVTAGDLAGNGHTEIAVGSGPGMEQVKIFNLDGSLLRTYPIADPSASLGVHVGLADVDNDGKLDLLLSVGTDVQARDPLTNKTKETVTPFDPTVLGGVFVG